MVRRVDTLNLLASDPSVPVLRHRLRQVVARSVSVVFPLIDWMYTKRQCRPFGSKLSVLERIDQTPSETHPAVLAAVLVD